MLFVLCLKNVGAAALLLFRPSIRSPVRPHSRPPRPTCALPATKAAALAAAAAASPPPPCRYYHTQYCYGICHKQYTPMARDTARRYRPPQKLRLWSGCGSERRKKKKKKNEGRKEDMLLTPPYAKSWLWLPLQLATNRHVNVVPTNHTAFRCSHCSHCSHRSHCTHYSHRPHRFHRSRCSHRTHSPHRSHSLQVMSCLGDYAKLVAPNLEILVQKQVPLGPL